MAHFAICRDLFSVLGRVLAMVHNAGVIRGLKIATAALDDRHLRHFDRSYGIQTTGIIALEATTFPRSRLRQATCYGPVNGWAFRHLLQRLALPKRYSFADLGSGLGRACIIAAEYGFNRVTGIELVGEFCAAARDNVSACYPPHGPLSPITIREMDVLAYCRETEDDVFFMYRPFSGSFFSTVLDRLADRAREKHKVLTVIFSERVALPGSFAPLLTSRADFNRMDEVEYWGQEFWVYQCGGPLRP